MSPSLPCLCSQPCRVTGAAEGRFTTGDRSWCCIAAPTLRRRPGGGAPPCTQTHTKHTSPTPQRNNCSTCSPVYTTGLLGVNPFEDGTNTTGLLGVNPFEDGTNTTGLLGVNPFEDGTNNTGLLGVNPFEDGTNLLALKTMRKFERLDIGGLRADGGEGGGDRKIPEKTTSTSGIVRPHDTHARQSGSWPRPGIEPGSPWWEASRLTAQPPRPPFMKAKTTDYVNISTTCPPLVQRATAAERLACSPPTKAIRARSPAGSLRIFACRILLDDAADGRVFSRGSPLPHHTTIAFQRCSIPCFTLVGWQDLDVKSRPNLFTRCSLTLRLDTSMPSIGKLIHGSAIRGEIDKGHLIGSISARFSIGYDRPIMNAVKYKVVSGVVWTNRTMVSSNTDTNRTGVLAVVDIDSSGINPPRCYRAGNDVTRAVTRKWPGLNPTRVNGYARLHHRGSKLDPRLDLRSTQKTVAPFVFTAGLEIEIEVHFEPPISAVRNLDPRSAAIVDKCSFKIRQQIELRSIRADEGGIRLVWSIAGMRGADETRSTRENPATSGIVRHDSHMRRGATPPVIEPASPWWEAKKREVTVNGLYVRQSSGCVHHVLRADATLRSSINERAAGSAAGGSIPRDVTPPPFRDVTRSHVLQLPSPKTIPSSFATVYRDTCTEYVTRFVNYRLAARQFLNYLPAPSPPNEPVVVAQSPVTSQEMARDRQAFDRRNLPRPLHCTLANIHWLFPGTVEPEQCSHFIRARIPARMAENFPFPPKIPVLNSPSFYWSIPHRTLPCTLQRSILAAHQPMESRDDIDPIKCPLWYKRIYNQSCLSNGRSRILARGNRSGQCRWTAGFLGELPIPRPFIPALFHNHITSLFIGSQDLDA
ncbi:hypothetical protein PR048_033607 [Dryococelus australis]|uniref:Uncharacterized protein n=1 Tax=Dryococelus australis TaxID=614101 RepID=A0ABQ9G407_9NEOP|nr:hypothetical protein PR048_033607 [Dryococelus australis]